MYQQEQRDEQHDKQCNKQPSEQPRGLPCEQTDEQRAPIDWHALDIPSTLKILWSEDSNSSLIDVVANTSASNAAAANVATASNVARVVNTTSVVGNIDEIARVDTGLSTATAQLRHRQYGHNQLVTVKPQNLIVRFLRQFHNILIYILQLSAVIAVLLQRWVDATVILGVIVLNAIVGFIQEGKAEKALAAIRDMLAPIAKVVRDGKRSIIPAVTLVPGDVVIIERGDKVPADLRLLETRSLFIQEAILTGEAHAVEKFATQPVRATAPLAERTTLAYSGTIVTSGYGIGAVIGIGSNTQIGKISSLLSSVAAPETPLLRQMNRFGYWLTLIILLSGALTFAFGALVWGDSSKDMFMAIVGLIVAAVPEGLPPILTIILALGVTRMAKCHAIIRRLPAVETMGAVTTICSDKTGTLTCNELTAEDVVTSKGHYRLVQGLIHVTQDDLHAADTSVVLAEHHDLEIALLAGAVCNDAELDLGVGDNSIHHVTRGVVHSVTAHDDGVSNCKNSVNTNGKNSEGVGESERREGEREGERSISEQINDNKNNQPQAYGDPLDQALLMLAHRSGIDVVLLEKTLPRTDLIPYESEHKFMATLHHDHVLGKAFIYVKGAPENILSMCDKQQLDGATQPLDLQYWQQQVNVLARKGEKIIAIAYKEVATGQQQLRFADIASLTMVAIFGIIDPPREEVAAAIAECHAAGINVKMITGDHIVTAQAIAESIGIMRQRRSVSDISNAGGVNNAGDASSVDNVGNASGVDNVGDADDGGGRTEILTGQEIDLMDDEELARRVVAVNVFARTSPEHKLRLVKMLQRNQQVVAMTGDGVNDAPALRQADIGVAMGEKGTDIAKEAAAMVLTDDNFATIVQAVAEGRTIYDNLKKTILYILPTSIAQALSIVVAIFFGLQAPITAVQILWVNMITAVALSLPLGFEEPQPDVMARPPRRKDEPLLSIFLAWRVAFVSLLLVAAVFALSLWETRMGVGFYEMRTVAVNMIVMGEIVYLLNCRRIFASVLNWSGIRGSKYMWLAIAAVLVLQLLFTYVPMMQHFFGTASIDAKQWLLITGLAAMIFVLIEGEKWILRVFGK